MCNLYRLTTSVAAMRALFGASGDLPDLPARLELYPGRPAPVVVGPDESRLFETQTWGVPPPPGGNRPVTNIRNLDSPFWRSMLGAAARCLVPVSAFAEWSASPDPATGRKRKHWFAVPSAPLFAFAGLWRATPSGRAFAFLTTAPNALVASVHPRAMPVLLGPADFAPWLAGAPAAAFQRAWPDSDMALAPD